MKKIIVVLILFDILLPVFPNGQGEQEKEISIFVSILPQVYFVERIGGSRVMVQELVPPGREPHVFEPGPRQIASLSKADIYFTIGVPFEKVFIPRIKDTIRDLKIIDTTQGIRFRHFHYIDENPHDDEDMLGTQDPHIWLGTEEVKIQLGHIVNALVEFDPPGKEIYESQYKQFLLEIDTLHFRIAGALAPVKGKKFFVFHPAFGYFADEYGLEQFPVEIEGKEPGARQLARIIEMAIREKVKVIFVQPQFSQKKAQMIAEHTGAVVIPIDPLQKNWLENMEEIAQKIEKGL